jgi:hypothetical protein
VFIGQFVRVTIQAVYSSNDVDTKPVSIPDEIVNIIVFIQQLCQFAGISRELVTEFIPPYVYDSVKSQN